VLHITDGESVAGTLRESSVRGDVRVYGDLLYEGLAPRGMSRGARIEARARLLPENRNTSLVEARRLVTEYEDTLEAAAGSDNVFIWLDYRLSDQLILIRLLDWFSNVRPLAGG
jgi:hypothetical protein